MYLFILAVYILLGNEEEGKKETFFFVWNIWQG